MPIKEYLNQIKKGVAAGNHTEHSYRHTLLDLLPSMVQGISVTNEPRRQACGSPDYIVQRGEVPLGYIEAKDVGVDLDREEKSEQMQRYLAGLDNLILTDYLDFRFFRHQQKIGSIRLASVENGKFVIHLDALGSFETYIKDFCHFSGQTIKSAEKLAKIMAQKARIMEEIILRAVVEDIEYNSLKDQLKAFRNILIHDLDEKTFADIYAQTIAYGLFAARLHDKTLETFSRQEARELIPRTNPFLRSLFDYISGAELDERIVWIVDELAEIFRATNIKEIMQDFGKLSGQTDPFIHFYETFLQEYDPDLRTKRGVFYTPEPVVNFIVRAVDDILKTEFGLPDGLADTSKIKIKRKIDGTATKSGNDLYEEKEVHKVQVLDVATGTGTFLSEIIKHIYKRFEGQQGVWSNYVEEHLLPRLHGFEILMAPYAMCHLKIELLLAETGYVPKNSVRQQRLRVFLTNTLEEAHPDTGSIFAGWLSHEATEANLVKRDTPLMVLIGNPPYANFGQMNQGEWIKGLIADYKKDLNEKKINLDDDYIKFIRYGQYCIEKNGEGILAYISNNSFIDGITHRQMRKSLLDVFTSIYVLNLHGSSMRYEQSPDGSKDENVFDIRTGVSINIFVKNKKDADKNAKVCYLDLYGNRQSKYSSLLELNVCEFKQNELNPQKPWWFFIPQKANSFTEKGDFSESIASMFSVYGNGIGTDRDGLFYDLSISNLSKRFETFYSPKGAVFPFAEDYRVQDSSSYPILTRRATTDFSPSYIQNCLYRPFENRYLYYNQKLISRPAYDVMKHLQSENLAILLTRQLSTDEYRHVFITKSIVDRDPLSLATRERTQVFPLYLYPDEDSLETERRPNLNMDIVTEIAGNLGLKFTNEKEDSPGTFAPIDLLDYIYAVLHSPAYREKYKEFLKIDFPRVPYPEDKKAFWKLVKLGGELRQIHLLEHPVVAKPITTYPVAGSNLVTRAMTTKNPGFELTSEAKGTGRVWINDTQYFDKVPEIAWNFYIGGYQPAQKWLKDRKGRELNFDDITHYQKIIVALTETDKLMKKVDEVAV